MSSDENQEMLEIQNDVVPEETAELAVGENAEEKSEPAQEEAEPLKKDKQNPSSDPTMLEEEVAFREEINKAPEKKRSAIIGGVTTGVSLIVFIVAGSVWGIWHPAWIVFLIGGIFARLIEFTIQLIEHKKFDARAISDFIGSALFCAAIIVFIVLGLLKGIWHPAWIAFPAAMLASAIVDIIVKSVKKESK